MPARSLSRPMLLEAAGDPHEHLFEPRLPAREVYGIRGGCRFPSVSHNPKGAAAASSRTPALSLLPNAWRLAQRLGGSFGRRWLCRAPRGISLAA